MVYVPVQCPRCHSTEVIKAGKQANRAQRYRCQNKQCARRIFLGFVAIFLFEDVPLCSSTNSEVVEGLG